LVLQLIQDIHDPVHIAQMLHVLLTLLFFTYMLTIPI